MYKYSSTAHKHMSVLKIKTLLIVVSFTLVTLLPQNIALAKSGCCSWHGGVSYCDTSAGRYVCNDGTYSPSCGCTYIAPKPVCVYPSLKNGKGNYTFSQNGCSQDVTFTWDKGTNDDFYSIGISKNAGADPGPLSDTNTQRFVFKDVKPGKWYINVKPGRSCGWGDIVYWEVDVPEATPQVTFKETLIDEEERNLEYSVKCATKAEISPEIGTIKVGDSFVKIKPTADITYTLTATNGTSTIKRAVYVKYPLIKETPVNNMVVESTQSSEKSTSSNKESSNNLVSLGLLAGVGGLIWYARKH